MSITVVGFNEDKDTEVWLPTMTVDGDDLSSLNLAIKAYIAKYGPCSELEVYVKLSNRDWTTFLK